MHSGKFRVECIFISDAISLDFSTKIPFDLSILKHYCKQHVSLFCIVNCRKKNKKKKSVKYQGDMLNFCDFIQVYVFTANHYLNKSVTDDVVQLRML